MGDNETMSCHEDPSPPLLCLVELVKLVPFHPKLLLFYVTHHYVVAATRGSLVDDTILRTVSVYVESIHPTI